MYIYLYINIEVWEGEHMSCTYSMSCIYTYVYLVRVDLDIIFLVVSDGDDSTKGWKFLFENCGVFQLHELHEISVHSEYHHLVHQIITKTCVASGDNLVGTAVNALAEAR